MHPSCRAMLGGSTTSGALRSPGSSQPSRTCPLLLEHIGGIFLLLFLCAMLMASTGTLRVRLLAAAAETRGSAGEAGPAAPGGTGPGRVDASIFLGDAEIAALQRLRRCPRRLQLCQPTAGLEAACVSSQSRETTQAGAAGQDQHPHHPALPCCSPTPGCPKRCSGTTAFLSPCASKQPEGLIWARHFSCPRLFAAWPCCVPCAVPCHSREMRPKAAPGPRCPTKKWPCREAISRV